MSATAHVFVSIVSISALLFIVRLVRRRQMRTKYSLLWLSVGVLMTLLAISPRSLEWVSRRLGIAYPPTTLFIAAIVLLLLVSVHFSWELSRLEERTRTLAEELAIITAMTPDDAVRERRHDEAAT